MRRWQYGSILQILRPWWQSVAEDFPTLHLYALDTLSCPAMSTECERAFGSAKKLLTPERNALSIDIIEACECLKLVEE
jgi:hypothetical protein